MIYKQMFKTFKLVVILALLTISFGDKILMEGQLTIVKNPSKPSTEGKSITLIPASFSTSAENINDYIVTIRKASPYDGCTRLSQPDYEEDRSDYPVFLLIDGGAGKCGYKRRAQMAKDYGAKGLIIIDDKLDQANDPYSSYQDQTFLVFLTKSETQGLLDQDQFTGSITMTQQSDQQVEVSIWLSALNKQSYDTIYIWNQTLLQIPAIAAKVKWNARYAFYGCDDKSTYAQIIDCSDKETPYCACDGAFCSPEICTNFIMEVKQTPDTVVHEDIRQKIIFVEHPTKYMPYMAAFYSKCFNKFKEEYSVQQCSNSIMNSLNLDYNKINGRIDTDSECKNDVFAELLLDRDRFAQLNYYPAVIIHREPIEFKNKKDFQSKICKRLSLEKAAGCIDVIRYETILSTSLSILFFVAIVAGLILVGALVVICYRKTLRKQMQKEVKMQVSASVENYFALTDSK